jgi:hypothetical protein
MSWNIILKIETIRPGVRGGGGLLPNSSNNKILERDRYIQKKLKYIC